MEELDFTATARDEIYDPAIAQTCFEALGKLESVKEGKTFFEHNQASDRMYLLLEGQVRLIRGEKTLDIIKPGEIFGEMALVDQSPRAANAVAETDAELLPVNRDDFLSLVKTKPAFAVSLLRSLAERLRRMTARQA